MFHLIWLIPLSYWYSFQHCDLSTLVTSPCCCQHCYQTGKYEGRLQCKLADQPISVNFLCCWRLNCRLILWRWLDSFLMEVLAQVIELNFFGWCVPNLNGDLSGVFQMDTMSLDIRVQRSRMACSWRPKTVCWWNYWVLLTDLPSNWMAPFCYFLCL